MQLIRCTLCLACYHLKYLKHLLTAAPSLLPMAMAASHVCVTLRRTADRDAPSAPD